MLRGGYRITLIGENDLQLGTLISDARFTDCHLYLDCPSIHHTNSIENALMLAFAFAGAHQGVLLMHASVPMIGNKGYIFQGKSARARVPIAAFGCRPIGRLTCSTMTIRPFATMPKRARPMYMVHLGAGRHLLPQSAL